MSENVLHVENVTMQFGGVVAVNNLSLDVNKNEIVALIGPNGAGKTTAFNCITGVYEPTNGLDPHGIIEMRELILKLNREQGITVLISSHILDELSRLATHYGFIDGGRMVREMSAEELEACCRKCIRMEVSDTKTLARVLDSMNAEYRISDEHHADVYAEIPVTSLVSALAKENCTVKNIKEHDESLESFYMNLVGGERHA